GEAERLVELLREAVGVCKIGKQLFLHAGPEVVRMVHRHGAEVFLDLKFHDIPHTVARAGVEAARLGVRFFDLHASGSFEMMERTHAEVARACRREALRRPKISPSRCSRASRRAICDASGWPMASSRRWGGSRGSPAARAWTGWSHRRSESPASGATAGGGS